ncbi:hypothetical protein ERJ75_001184900 [Trypanosoma vivax]|nr:hypothetical protein ERJ75_001184900 [Trypanosoma vivax]
MRDAARIALDVSGKAAAAAFASAAEEGCWQRGEHSWRQHFSSPQPARQRVARAEEEAKALATALGQHADAARSSALLFVDVAAGVEALVGIAGSIVDTNAGSGIVKTCSRKPAPLSRSHQTTNRREQPHSHMLRKYARGANAVERQRDTQHSAAEDAHRGALDNGN